MGHTEKFKLKVFYTWGENSIGVFDPGFDRQRSWDIDLLSGYDHFFVKNISKHPGSHHYNGIVNPDLIDQVSGFNPNAILVYGWKFNAHLKLLRHFKGKTPIIFRGDSTLLDYSSSHLLKSLLRKQVLKWVYSHIDFALSPGKAADAYFKWVKIPANKIIRAPHAVDNERFQNADHQQAQHWRKELGISDDKKVFLFAGKFESKKDPQLLLNAFIELSKKRNDIHLIIVGNGIIQQELKQLASTSSTPSTISTISTITFLPFQNQSKMPLVYRLADVFVLPSKGPGETWGLAVNEAMACGIAVIVSDKCGCAQDLVQDGVNGFVFHAANVEALVQAMEKTLFGDAYKNMGLNSTNIIQQFSNHSFLEALQSIPI